MVKSVSHAISRLLSLLSLTSHSNATVPTSGRAKAEPGWWEYLNRVKQPKGDIIRQGHGQIIGIVSRPVRRQRADVYRRCFHR